MSIDGMLPFIVLPPEFGDHVWVSEDGERKPATIVGLPNPQGRVRVEWEGAKGVAFGYYPQVELEVVYEEAPVDSE